MEIITSKQNETIKETKLLQDKSGRIKSHSFLVEGFKIIEEAKNSEYNIKTIFCLEKYFERAKQYCQNVIVVNDIIIKYLSTTLSPQGVIAVIEEKETGLKSEITSKFLILDNLQNPDNLGSVIRSAVAFGFNQIFLLNCVDQFNEKVIRSAMGNLFKVFIKKIKIEQIKELAEKRTIYCADMSGENIHNIKSFEDNCGLVIGNEGNGVSMQVLQYCKKKICILMQNGVESLNASVSAGIIMFEMNRR